MPTVIRKAGPDEAGKVHSIMVDAFEVFRDAVPPTSVFAETAGSVRRDLETKEEAVLCLRDGVPVGSARFSVGEELFFHRLAVLRSEQGKGIGTAMVRWLEREAALRGANGVWLKVRATAPRNVGFYRRLGYEAASEREEVNPVGHAVMIVTMRKRLPSK